MSPDVTLAEVMIRRRRVWSGSLLPWTVWLDDAKVGKLRVGGSLTIQASPGDHAIMVRQLSLGSSNGQPFRFNARKGELIELVTQAAGISGEARIWRRATRTIRAGVSYEVIEGKYFEVDLNDETRIIDNSQSASPATRKVSVTREWAKTCSLSADRVTVVRGGARLGPHPMRLEAEAERTLKNTYSVTTVKREVFTEEVTITVGAHTKSKVIFSWKEKRQEGIVRVRGTDFEMDYPYEVVVGPTFDQRQVDVA